MPQKTLLELREGLNIRQYDDWCGVHAIARAQQIEMGWIAERRNNHHLRYRQQMNGQVMIQGDLGGCLNQTMEEMPLVELIDKIDGFVQERRDSSALVMELSLSCTNPSK